MRHEDARYPVPDLLRDGLLEVYQAHQGKPVFDCDVVMSFLGPPQRRAVLYGVYGVNGVEECTSAHRGRLPPKYKEWAAPGHYYYHLTRRQGFSDLEGRVVIDWGLSTRSWHQWRPATPRKLFVSLPVRDLQRAITFYEALGFTFNPQATDVTA